MSYRVGQRPCRLEKLFRAPMNMLLLRQPTHVLPGAVDSVRRDVLCAPPALVSGSGMGIVRGCPHCRGETLTNERAMVPCIVACRLLVEGDVSTIEDETVHIFRASDWETAFARARQLGRGHEPEYRNADGELVRWRLAQIATLDIVRAPDLDGAEVYSRLTEVSVGPAFDTTFDPRTTRLREAASSARPSV